MPRGRSPRRTVASASPPGFASAERTPWELGNIAALSADDRRRWVALEQRLVGLGGARVVVTGIDEDLDELLDRGVMFDAAGAVLQRSRMSQCHENAAVLAAEGRVRIATGYALSDDGIWRQHSWVVGRHDDILIETTERREAYFGVLLDEAAQRRFMFAHLM